mgnify:CR=1 FL=1
MLYKLLVDAFFAKLDDCCEEFNVLEILLAEGSALFLDVALVEAWDLLVAEGLKLEANWLDKFG